MLDTLQLAAIYVLPFVVVLAIYLSRRRGRSNRAQNTYKEAEEAGLTEPASLHPDINPALCCGAGACVKACPEKTVIGVVNGKAKLVDPTACIGHGACAAACPTQAITLVFGTATRGVELPQIKPNFETNVPGLFIAGELGGMGLIRNAVTQGRQAMDSIGEHLKGPHSLDALDVLIVGAGPAGFSAALSAKEKGLNYKVIEQDSFGGTVSHFPRGKLVMTQPAELAIIGKVKFSEVSKEELLAFWDKVREEQDLDIDYGRGLTSLTSLQGGGFKAVAGDETYEARAVLLAIGRRGTPRKLGIPGEERSSVVYRMVDPAQYKGQNVIVVGGGDSALEAAATIAEETDATVTLAYRGASFPRAKKKNRARVDAAKEAGRLNLLLNSNLTEIGDTSSRVDRDGEEIEVPSDAIIVCAGGVLPNKMLAEVGIETVTKYGEV